MDALRDAATDAVGFSAAIGPRRRLGWHLAAFVLLAPPEERLLLLMVGAAAFDTTYVHEMRVTLGEEATGTPPLP